MSLTNQEIATRWAKRGELPREEFRSRNMFCTRDTIYSYGYHYPIATFRSDGAVMFNADPSSKTTERHKRIVRWALYRDRPPMVFTLPREFWNNEHALSILFYKKKIENAVACWRRARRYKDSNMRNAVFYLQEFKTYCAFHKLSLKRILKRDGVLAAAVAVIALNPVPETEY